jgi:glutaredoxin
MRKIRILTLSYCDVCKWLKSELSKEGLEYKEIDVEMFDSFASDIEKKFKTEHYPIIFLENDQNIITILPATELEPSPILHTFDTIPQAIQLIKQHI